MKNKNVPLGDFVGSGNVSTKDNGVNNANKKKDVKKKDKKPGFFSKLGGKIKDVFSELKKVSWPKFPKVVKQTGIVLVVVLAFLIVITAFDTGLLELLKIVAPRG